MARNRRNNFREKKKPYATESLIGIGVGAFSMILFVGFMFCAAMTGGNVGKLVSAMSVICFVAAIVALVKAYKMKDNENFNKVFRVSGIVVPAVAVACWTILYIIGIVVA
ncbi:MAG: hypothetical protein II765_07420 [Lachnospiraceae bacterium]|jgi:hypothetical protein|nr:hypothetical protein [Lachnospiraceae bacterium]MBQ4301350.1 hypothetical protein [Lachnospiraceae bacterium]